MHMVYDQILTSQPFLKTWIALVIIQNVTNVLHRNLIQDKEANELPPKSQLRGLAPSVHLYKSLLVSFLC